jgi:hypothetical protein
MEGGGVRGATDAGASSPNTASVPSPRTVAARQKTSARERKENRRNGLVSIVLVRMGILPPSWISVADNRRFGNNHMGLVDPFDMRCVIVFSHLPAGYGKVRAAARITGNPVDPAYTPAFLRAVVSETFHVCATGQQCGESRKKNRLVCLHAFSSGIFEVMKMISGIRFM